MMMKCLDGLNRAFFNAFWTCKQIEYGILFRWNCLKHIAFVNPDIWFFLLLQNGEKITIAASEFSLLCTYNIVRDISNMEDAKAKTKSKSRSRSIWFLPFAYSPLNITTIHLLIYIQSTDGEHWTIVKLFE